MSIHVATLSSPDLYPSAPAFLSIRMRSQILLSPLGITRSLSILLWELLNCFSYLADWFWLALLSLGSLTGWWETAAYTIAGKLVNLKCPGIWCCFNMAFACLCSYISCSADSQTSHKWGNIGFLQISHLPISEGIHTRKQFGFLFTLNREHTAGSGTISITAML